MFRTSAARVAPFGVIGLGQMGARMAPHVLRGTDCDELVVYDAVAASVDLLKQHPLLKTLEGEHGRPPKITVASSAAEVARACPALLTMLPNGPIVREVYATSVFPHARRGVVCLDCSTTDPSTPQDLARQLHELDPTALFCDAPVSGGIVGAEAGTLAIMVGATDFSAARDHAAAFERAHAYLRPFARTVLSCGGVGSGAVCKLCNNLILGQHMVAVSEAMLLAARYGVEGKVLQSVVTNSTGKSWSGDVANPVPGVVEKAPSSHNYKPGFGVQLMLKDIQLAVEAAAKKQLHTPGAATAASLYAQTAANAAWADKDFSVVIQCIDAK